MALLYHWRKENYRSYMEEWAEDHDLNLIQNSHSWRDAESGESVWAFSRREDGVYVLVASYQIESVDEEESEYGRWIAFSFDGSTRFYNSAVGADIEPLIRELPLSMNNPTLGRNFQGPAGVKRIPPGFEDSFADFASRQQLLSKHEDDSGENLNTSGIFAAKIALPDELMANHIQQAFVDFETDAVEHRFIESEKFDVLFEGKRYPPKAIAALATKRQIGQLLRPRDFTAGANSKCFRLIRDAGYRIVPKSGVIPFIAGSKYSRPDVKDNIGTLEDTSKGDWATDYHFHVDSEAKITGWFFIFANIGTGGRTGHNDANRKINATDFFWEAKTRTNVNQPLMKRMLGGEFPVLFFTRENDRNKFTFEGVATPLEVGFKTPVSVTWRVISSAGSRLSSKDATEEGIHYIPSSDDHRTVALREIKQRKGQAKFRQALLEAFNHKCAITGCDIIEILEAAHINPARGIKDNHVSNGLLLRADIHTLFDLQLLGIHPETLKIHLKKEVNKSPYAEIINSTIIAEHVVSRQSLWVRWQQFLMS